ncbi:unnamed protein product [Lactuca virosa]|uniref:Uncharacterized protein n=1 Tax=Lactuca virosa TaxID=75947 RepID=A0AAU9NZL9_9ASTR|nr:unnamed protein product [Lactuca virosa]
MFNDVDFSSMTYSEFVTFLEHFMHEECKKLYYCEPGNSLMEGLNPISDDVEYDAFIFYAYGTDGVISVYVDHIGVGVDGWFDDDERESCIDGENEDNIDELRNVDFEFNEDTVHMNRTSNVPFLSNLCVDEGEDNNIGSRSEPQQHEEVEMTPVEMDTTQNDMQATPNDVESSSAGDFSHYMKVTPPRTYEGEEGVVGEEAEEGGNVQDDEVIPNVQVVDNAQIQKVIPIIQVQQGRVRPISEISKRIRRRKSERILKLKLGKRIGGVDDP